MSRRLARESALQCLFEINVGQVAESDAVQHIMSENNLEEDRYYFERLVQGTCSHRSQIDEVISKYSVGWKLDRMPNVDLNVLRLSVYELLYERDTPPKVAVNEAIELAKAFSTEESGKFVNGILGKILMDLDEVRGFVQK
jgi:N utilization substance protein B